MPVHLGPSSLQSTSAQAACVEVKVPHAWSIFSDVATCWGSTEGTPCLGALSGAERTEATRWAHSPLPTQTCNVPSWRRNQGQQNCPSNESVTFFGELEAFNLNPGAFKALFIYSFL